MQHSKSQFRHFIELNLAVFCISTSGALGRYISLPVPLTTESRAVIACVLIYLFCKGKKFDFKIQTSDIPSVVLSGFLMGVHWVTYFYSLQMSNVAIGMLSLFTYPVITSLLEPLILKTRFQRMHILLGLMVLAGTLLLVPEFDLAHDYFIAILLGLTSALAYSLRNLITKSKVGVYNGSVLMFYQLIVVSVCLFPSFFMADMNQLQIQVPWLILLALVTTAIGHTLLIYSFRHFSVTSASFISSMQPVYGIVLGMLFLGEYPTLVTVFGGILILASVLLESVNSFRTQKLLTNKGTVSR
ncbi:MAG: hypothetical protein RLZZ241_856 [Bacteroidota bacterium]|jgi:drug/metabolite transporter (DMT)-like permease